MILSKESGCFKELWFEPSFQRDNLLEEHCNCKVGDLVCAYRNTSHSLGTILFKAESLERIKEITENIGKYYKVILE